MMSDTGKLYNDKYNYSIWWYSAASNFNNDIAFQPFNDDKQQSSVFLLITILE